eukprot:359585-Chlamydomonas_euryale.AAC.3
MLLHTDSFDNKPGQNQSSQPAGRRRWSPRTYNRNRRLRCSCRAAAARPPSAHLLVRKVCHVAHKQDAGARTELMQQRMAVASGRGEERVLRGQHSVATASSWTNTLPSTSSPAEGQGGLQPSGDGSGGQGGGVQPSGEGSGGQGGGLCTHRVDTASSGPTLFTPRRV